jgi:hypothetical protein
METRMQRWMRQVGFAFVAGIYGAYKDPQTGREVDEYRQLKAEDNLNCIFLSASALEETLLLQLCLAQKSLALLLQPLSF